MFRAIVSLCCFLVFGCSPKKEDFLFKTLDPNRTGINFDNLIINTPKLNILNYLYFYNGGGVCAGDFNNDGFVDLYFTSNQQADKLYLNQGHLKFKDGTKVSGIDNSQGWTNGVTSVDINHDGLLDIYVSKTSDFLNLKGKNLLFVNQGIQDGIPSFKEEAQLYGLDISGFSTQAVFFDYDLDGDLDMFQLNHSVHPNRTYGNGKIRESIDVQSGDRLFENRDGFYVDVSIESKIFQGRIGYGLGLSIGDLNNDNYPDLYIGNDFFENDYLYINQKNGSFKDMISSESDKIGHTTHYSMGNAIGDLNNDGLPDILSLDMLPEDLTTYRTSGQEYPYQIYNQYLKNGYSPQYMQNTLQLNMGDEDFSEVAFLSGIAATEWSWCPLIADFDNDGKKDLYITNGILGATNDMDFISFISNDKIQRHLDEGVKESDMAFIKDIPQKKTINYFYRNNGNLTFENVTEQWAKSIPSFSNGAVYADLDNDGDLDIVVNNVNDKAFVLENTLQ
ncbi:MAG: VCBS repeat-containing protein, partial [Aquaticitalea sp.]